MQRINFDSWTIADFPSFTEQLNSIQYPLDKVPRLFCCAIQHELMNEPIMIDHLTDHVIDAATLKQLEKINATDYRNPFSNTPFTPLQQFKIESALLSYRAFPNLIAAITDPATKESAQRQMVALNNDIQRFQQQINLRKKIANFVDSVVHIHELKEQLSALKLTALKSLLAINPAITEKEIQIYLSDHEEIKLVKSMLILALEDFIVFTEGVVHEQERLNTEENMKEVQEIVEPYIALKKQLTIDYLFSKISPALPHLLSSESSKSITLGFLKPRLIKNEKDVAAKQVIDSYHRTHKLD